MEWSGSGIILLALLSVINASPTMVANGDFKPALPTNTKPIHYDLTLALSVDGTRTTITRGWVKIWMEVVHDVKTITLNNRGLDINGVKFMSEYEPDDHVHTIGIEKADDFMHIQTDTRTFVKGEKVSAEIKFTGSFQTSSLLGIYRTQYEDNGAKR